MNKIKIEHKEKDVWKSVKVKANVSRNGNMYAKYHTEESDGSFVEHVLVWKDMRNGTPVVEKVGKKWVQVGRVTHGEVFLGEGQSYSEYAHSPEGLEASRKVMESWRKERFGEQKPVKRFEFPTEV